MLEDVVRKVKISFFAASLSVIVAAGGCSAYLPPHPPPPVERHLRDCCEVLDCVSKGYDYCNDEGMIKLEGTYYSECSCHHAESCKGAECIDVLTLRTRGGHWENPH